ncbi:MAG: S-layer homology domain-containing protein [Firmicutes bacterium]|nr:S-layer homology domain-containing protein [Bacillota bacterium]
MGKRRLMKFPFIILVATFAVFIFGGVASAGFTDVSDSHWAADSIDKMSSRGVVAGYTDGTFKPDKTVTQAQAVTMAVRAKGLRSFAGDNLPDVSFPVPGWAEQDIKLAIKHGLLKETDQFSAYSGATRDWTTRLLVRLAGLESRVRAEILQPNFTDAGIIPDWAQFYVRVAQDEGLVTGYDGGVFRPRQAVSRAEMVAFLDRAVTRLPGSTATGPTTAINTGSPGQMGGKVSGSIIKVFPESNTFVVRQHDGVTRVLSLPENASVSVEGSGASGLNALRQGDEVVATLNAAGHVIGIVVDSRSGGGGDGIVFDLDLDLDPSLLTMEYEDGALAAYQLAPRVAVFIEGTRFPTLPDVHKGDRVRLTVRDNLVTEIEVLEQDARLDVTGEVVVLDTDRDVINLDVDGVLKAYRLALGLKVTVPGLKSAHLSDVEVGDTVRGTGKDGAITLLEVEGREAGESFVATIVAVDNDSRVLTLEEHRGGDVKAYEVLDKARIIIDDDEESLGKLARDMEVMVRLLDGDVIFVEVDNAPTGTITDVDEKGLLLVLRRDNGDRVTYVIDRRVDVESKDGRDKLDEVNRGDYAKLMLDDDRVEEIRLRHTITCRVESVLETRDRLEVVDEDGDTGRLYVRDSVDLVVPGVNYPRLDDVSRGDLALVTYLGRSLERVEVLKPYHGSVSSLDIYSRSLTLKLFDGGTKSFSYPTGSRVVTGDRTYDSFSALAVGDRVEVVENTGGGYTFSVMEKVTGKLASKVDRDGDNIYLRDGYEWVKYQLDERVWVHGTGGYVYSIDRLKNEDSVRLYLLRGMVYAIEVY